MNTRLEISNDRQQTILQAVLDHSLNGPEGADVKRFRFRFLKDREILEKLESGQFIKRNHDQTKYEPSLAGLCLTESDQSKKLFADIDRVCDVLRDHYKTHYDAPILIDDINEATGFEKQYLATCIKLLSAGTALVISTDLMSEGAEISVPEQLFHFDHYAEIAESLLPHFISEYCERKNEPNGNQTVFDRDAEITVSEQLFHLNHDAQITERSLPHSIPETRKRKTKPHGNKAVFERKRNKIREAAKVVLKKYPQECRARNGRVQATKIAEAIYNHSYSLFKGEPPLAKSTMEKLLRKNKELFK